MEKTLDIWVAQTEPIQEQEPEEEEEDAPDRFETMKEEQVGDVKVIMRKNERYRYIEVAMQDPKGNLRNSQFLPIWKNERVDGPGQAEEYFQGLMAWIKSGRKGNLLPFRYKDDPWHEEGA